MGGFSAWPEAHDQIAEFKNAMERAQNAGAAMNTPDGAQKFWQEYRVRQPPKVDLSDLTAGGSAPEYQVRQPPKVDLSNLTAGEPQLGRRPITKIAANDGQSSEIKVRQPPKVETSDVYSGREPITKKHESADWYESQMAQKAQTLLKENGISATVSYESSGRGGQSLRVDLPNGKTEKIALPGIASPEQVSAAIKEVAVKIIADKVNDYASGKLNKNALLDGASGKPTFDAAIKNWANVPDATVTQMKDMIQAMAAQHGVQIPNGFRATQSTFEWHPSLAVVTSTGQTIHVYNGGNGKF